MTKKDAPKVETPTAELVETLERAPRVDYELVDGELVEVPVPDPAR